MPVELAHTCAVAGVMVAGGIVQTEKLAAPLVPMPMPFWTLIGPVVAPTGTVATIVPSFVTENDATELLNFTCVVPVKFDPLMVTLVPARPF